MCLILVDTHRSGQWRLVFSVFVIVVGALIIHGLFKYETRGALPGIAVQSLLSLHYVDVPGRQTIFTYGNAREGSLTAYMSNDRLFRLSVTATAGTSFDLSTPISNIPLDKFFYLDCEFGSDENAAILSIFVNGKEVVSRSFEFPIAANPRSPSMALGGGAEMQLVSMGAYSRTLTHYERWSLFLLFKQQAGLT